MRPIQYERAADTGAALSLAQRLAGQAADGAVYFAGGTQLLDLMKLDVMAPRTLIDINPLQAEHGGIAADASGLTLGGLARMSAAADHPEVARTYPALRDALVQAASAQLRNMATLAGNILQRTRCNYFRDTSWHACNKRNPGSGCAAIPGVNRRLAVLGVSEHCIAHYPGDFAVALIALGAELDLIAPDGGRRSLPLADLHRVWGDTPHIETNLAPGELIAAIRVPAGPWTRRSLYRKVRDRDSYDFALASAAVALDLAPDGTVREARVGLGGLASKPWRAHEAEDALRGQRLDEAMAARAAEAAFASAVTQEGNAFKPELGRRTLVRALLEATTMEI
jgi:xanthine dehydrogenase YagS FAD-binding subunit